MDAPQRRKTKLDFKNIAAYRRARSENQSEFWSRFGVTQSGGSRYESGRSVPKPVRLLMHMFDAGRVTHADLAAAAGLKTKRK